MRKYTASMLSEGNHLFQASITILDNGVKLRIPNFWRDQETFFSFSDISGVELTTPSWYSILTYSTINFNLRGTWVEAHGFTKSDALTIKKLIDNGRYSGGNSSINEFGEDTSKFSASKQKDWINYQHDRQMRLDREERIAKRNEQNKELIPKLKKIIKEYWVEILSYGNNDDYNKLSEMVQPPGNINAKEELINYIKKLKKIIQEIYDDEYWEIEYKSINEEIWVDINTELDNIYISNLTNNFGNEDNIFDLDLEENLADDENNNPFQFPEFGWPNEIDKLKIIQGLTKTIKKYDDLHLDLLEDDDQVNENKRQVRFFVRNIFLESGREAISDMFYDIKDDGEDNEYTDELAILFSIINDIYKSGILEVKNKDDQQEFPFALQKDNVKEFLKNKVNSLSSRVSKIIDVTDNILDRIDKSNNF
jgi:hypothetical protein